MDQKHLQNILENLPANPGVYKMKDAQGHIIYVGKAKNLRNRVKSYFQRTQEQAMRTQKMVSQVVDLDYTVVGTELEALLLETNLIKELRPKYNILMKDDKNYVYVRITTDEDYPRITLVRKVTKDKARYYGPKTAAWKVKETFKMLKQILPFRHCNLDIKFVKKGLNREEVEVTNKVIKYPCLDYYIKRCSAPCIGHISKENYRKIIDKVIGFFEGRTEDIIEELKSQMLEAAQERKFEKAARIRDKLLHIQEILEKQRISDPHRKDTDIINYYFEEGKIYVNLFQIREGKLLNQENFILDVRENKELINDNEILESFLNQYYEKATDIPKEILIPVDFGEKTVFEEWLSQMKNQKVSILIPQKGEKNKLLELAFENAKSYAKQCRVRWMMEGKTPQDALEELKKHLKLEKLRRLECYDISHLGGTLTVGSMVVFENGIAKKEHYRTFKIRTLKEIKPDDYLCMKEILSRRLKYLRTASKAFKFIKPTKKLIPQIQKIIDDNPTLIGPTIVTKQYFLCIINDKKELLAFGRTEKANPESAEIRSLWVFEKYRGQKLGHDLMRRLIEKTKFKKYYVYVKPELRDYYEIFGFTEVKQIPNFFVERIRTDEKEMGEEGILLLVERKKALARDPSLTEKPDLLIIDGGKGQLKSALGALKESSLNIPAVSLAKREEEIFLPGETDSIKLSRDSEALKLLQRIRDEAHRFAITFQRDLREKHMTRSALDEIKGVGEKYRKTLLQKFGSLENIKSASITDLSQIVGKKLAEKIKTSL